MSAELKFNVLSFDKWLGAESSYWSVDTLEFVLDGLAILEGSIIKHKEHWALKNLCFQILVLEKTLESPLECKEIKLVNPKGN